MTLIKASGAHVDAILALVRRHVPEASVSTNVGAELNVRLPMQSSPQFPAMLKELDEKMGAVGVVSYGISITSVEDVFLKISGGDHFSSETDAVSTDKDASALPVGDAALKKKVAGDDRASLSDVLAAARKDQTGVETFLRHTRALLIKRWNYSRRDVKGLLYQIFLPSVLIALGLGLIQAGSVALTTTSYQLSTAQFNVARRGDQNKPIYPLVVPNFGFKASNASDGGFQDSAEVQAALRAGILSANASMDTLAFSSASVLNIKDPFGFIGGSINEPVTSYKRMSSVLLDDARQQVASKYGAYIWTRSGTIVPQQNLTQVGSVATYTVMFNSTGRHSGPLFTNLQNSALMSLLNPSAPGASISTRTHPLPLTQREASLFAGLLVFSAAIIFVLAFSFVASSTALFIVKEKEVSAKHQQLISGVGILAYWTANYIFDMSVYSITGLLTIALAYAFQINEFTSSLSNINSAFVLTMVLFGMALVGSSYLLSNFFRNPSSAQNSILFINIAAILLIVACQFLSQLQSTCTAELSLRQIFRLFPMFAFGYNLVLLAFLVNLPVIDASCDLLNGVKKSPSDYLPYNALDAKATGTGLWFLGVEGFVYFVLVIGIEYFLSQPSLRLWCSRDPKVAVEAVEEDEDVVAEANRVAAELKNPAGVSDVVIVDKIRKVYQTGKVAVRELSFGLPVGEVFGFLGINGAGKTSTLQILSGDILPSSGSGRLAGLDIITQQLQVRRLLGCEYPPARPLHPSSSTSPHAHFQTSSVSHCSPLFDFALFPCHSRLQTARNSTPFSTSCLCASTLSCMRASRVCPSQKLRPVST